MANEKTPVVWDDDTKKHRPLGTGEKMGGLDASSLLSSDSGNLLEAGSDGLAYLSGSGMVDPRADNLLEESDRGKLQVTVDRIAEWLDGHPQDAALLADAINVVSGDEGNVIVEGADKGAFLSKGAIAAAVAGMTDAQKAQLADAIAARIASDIADGKTIVASGGKLTSDPTNATAAQKKAINQALADASSGLVVDNSTGKLQVDFSQMPTDKFEALLKGLKMQIPLSANLSLYVDDDSDGDSLVDGRGTQAKPFKTLQACINYATQNYALGPYSISIYVAPGTYGAIRLPSFTHTTGSIVIRASNTSSLPLIASNAVSYAVSGFGGTWYLQDLDISSHIPTPSDSLNHSPGGIMATTGSTINLSGCSVSAIYDGAARSTIQVRLLEAFNNGTIILGTRAGVHNALNIGKGNANNATVLHSENSGYIALPTGDHADTDDAYTIVCTGTADNFAVCTLESRIYVSVGGQHYQHFSGDISVYRQYSINTGSSVLAPSDGFPGDSTNNILDSSTYCWYRTTGS